MKRFFLLFAAAAFTVSVLAQTPKDVKYVFTEASELNLIGKIHDNTPNPYHRVDTVKYKGFTFVCCRINDLFYYIQRFWIAESYNT